MVVVTVSTKKEYQMVTSDLVHVPIEFSTYYWPIEDKERKCITCGKDRSVSFWQDEAGLIFKIIYASCEHYVYEFPYLDVFISTLVSI